MNDLEEVLSSYLAIMSQYLKPHSIDSYCSFLRALQRELSSLPNGQMIDILRDWIKPNLGKANPLGALAVVFDDTFASVQKVGSYKKNDCKSALLSLGKFLFGQYDGQVYLTLDHMVDEMACKLVAQNAIFCTIAVAKNVKAGKLGGQVNKTAKGNIYYSWFHCVYQRMKNGQTRRAAIPVPKGQFDPLGNGTIILDDNTYANQAIKKAVVAGFPKYLKAKFNNFKDYVACHIWDGTCYDYRYFTSVFNIVLLPKSVFALSDHNAAAKQLLQYEAARRFGVYPAMVGQAPTKPGIYDSIHGLWRQQDEHGKALQNDPTTFSAI